MGQVFDHGRAAASARKIIEALPGHVKIFRLHEAAK